MMDEGARPSFHGRFACAALMSAGELLASTLGSSVSFMRDQCSCSKWHSFCRAGWVRYRVPCPEAASGLHLQEMGGE